VPGVEANGDAPSEAEAVRLIPVGERRDLDEARRILTQWMTSHLEDASQVRLSPLTTPSSAGMANETLMFDATWVAAGSDQRGGFVARVGSDPQVFLDADVLEHARLYETVGSISDVPVPRVYGTEDDPTVLGAPFFVMNRVPGRVVPDTPPYNQTGWVADLAPDERSKLWRNAFTEMCKLHLLDSSSFAFLDRAQRGTNGLEQSLNYWIEMLEASDDGRDLKTIVPATDWLRANLPANPRTGFAWGDARLPNVLFDGLRVAAVLDWDLVSLAGPITDLAWWLVYEVQASRGYGLAPLDGLGSPSEKLDLWQELTGLELEHLDFHLVFAAFRSAVSILKIAQLMEFAGTLPRSDGGFAVDNSATQLLASMLDIEPPGPTCLQWPGEAYGYT